MTQRIKIVKPESEFPELFVTVPNSWPRIKLAPLYDVQFGHKLHASKTFLRHLEWLQKEPYVLTWNGGDLIENAIIGSPGMFEQAKVPQEQFDEATKLLIPILPKMLFAIPGNHEARTEYATGFSIARQLAERCNIHYFPDYCFCTIFWRGHKFRIAAHHGSGAAQTAGGQLNAARKDIEWTAGIDLYWCFPAGTPVLMANGTTRSIETMKEGDQIISGSGRVVSVKGLTQQEFSGELVSMKALGWPEFQVTPNHPLSVLRQYSITQHRNGFHRADALVFKDALERVAFTEAEIMPDVSPDRMRLYGYYLSEGCVWESKERSHSGDPLRAQLSFCFSTDERETLVKDCKQLLAGMGYTARETVQGSHHSIVLRVCRKDAAAHFKTLFGKGAAHKLIPEIFLRYPKEHIRELLRGLFFGDGSTKRQGLELTTISRAVAEQATFLLSARLNEPASFSCRDRKGKRRSYVVFRGHHEGRGSKRKYTAFAGKWFSPLRRIERRSFVGPVYCLHVGDPDPTFVVGQFVVHNTGHLHQPRVDLVYRNDFNQRTGQMMTRQCLVIVSPSYMYYFGSYAAARRYRPGIIGLVVATLQADGRIDAEIHCKGKRL